MTALSADAKREFKRPPIPIEETYIIENGATLYLGSMVVLDTTSGHAQAGADASGTTDCVGVAVQFPDITNVGLGTDATRVRVGKGIVLVPCIAALYATASIGTIVYVEDDNLVTNGAGSAESVVAGRVHALGDDTNTLWVDTSDLG